MVIEWGRRGSRLAANASKRGDNQRLSVSFAIPRTEHRDRPPAHNRHSDWNRQPSGYFRGFNPPMMPRAIDSFSVTPLRSAARFHAS